MRVLLMARTDVFWPALRDDLDRRGYRCSQQPVSVLRRDESTVRERGDNFQVATAAFARRIGLSRAEVEVPDLSAPGYELVLAVHMAALASVLALRDGQAPPVSPDAVSQFLLDRERGHWAKTAQSSPNTAMISEAVMGRAVLLATLVQRTGHRAAMALVSRPELGPDPQGLLDLHERCYPPTVPGLLLEPLMPDRLGEDYLAAALDRDRACQTLAEDLLHGSDDQITGTALTVLLEAAHRHASVAARLVIPTVTNHPTIALTTSGASVARLVTLDGLDQKVLDDLRALLRDAIGPSGVSIRYSLGMAAAVQRLTDQALAAAVEPAQRAFLLADLAYWLGQAGRRDDALRPAEEATTIYRGLAEANPAAYLPALATSLNNLGMSLSQVGRREEALGPTEEATTIHRGLAETNPAAYLPDLATSLWSVAWICDQSRLDTETGLRAAQEAVEYFAALAAQLPAAYGNTERAAAKTLASLLETAGRQAEAAQLRRRFDDKD